MNINYFNFSITVTLDQALINKMLNWANQFNIFLFLPANGYATKQSGDFEFLLGADPQDEFTIDKATDINWTAWQQFIDKYKKDYLFGHINYDLHQAIEPIKHYIAPKNLIGFKTISFWKPNIVITYANQKIYIKAVNPKHIWQQILKCSPVATENEGTTTTWQHATKENYLQNVTAVKKHIAIGNCYELNYCSCFSSHANSLDTLNVFNKLNSISPNPFSAYYKNNYSYMMCSSPERFFSLRKNTIISQPIKGTAKRDLLNPSNDNQIKEALAQHYKERAENIMVVDLVRNDLSRICEAGSVQVAELCKVYSYPTVHQMVSTIIGELLPHTNFTSIIKNLFPMGSMTGAPKVKVMELISEYEQEPRGLYSGTVGYIAPDGAIDMNVVIRSIMYNQDSGLINFHTGSGITHYSIAENEFEECQLKAQAMLKALA
jgi:para-aminobenzoate synthetase component I